MTESNPTAVGDTNGPWLIEASDRQPLDLDSLPGYRDRRDYVGYVYVVALGENLVKVGKTTRPRPRIAAYVSESQVTDRPVTHVWVSASHLNASDNEKALIAFGREYSTAVLRKEYFEGLSFQRLVTYAGTLTYDPPTREALTELAADAKRQGESLKRMMFPGYMERMDRGGSPATPQDVIGSLFGRYPDGSYSLPTAGSLDGEADKLLQRIVDSADANNVIPHAVLDRTWVEDRTAALHRLVDQEASRLESHAHTNSLRHIEETYLEQAIRLGVLIEVRDDDDTAFGPLDPKVIRP